MINWILNKQCPRCGASFFFAKSLNDHAFNCPMIIKDEVGRVLAQYNALKKKTDLNAQLGNLKTPQLGNLSLGQGIASAPKRKLDEERQSYMPVADFVPAYGIAFGQSESGAHRGDGGSFGGGGATDSWSDTSSSSSSSSSSCDSGGSYDSGSSSDSGGSCGGSDSSF
jgi:hypothetical protein